MFRFWGRRPPTERPGAGPSIAQAALHAGTPEGPVAVEDAPDAGTPTPPAYAGDPGSAVRPAWAAFDPAWYCREYGAALASWGIDAPETNPAAVQAAYTTAGVRLHHSPNPYFSEEWYLATNPDVATAVALGQFASGFEHYGLDGHKARSPHWLFSEAFYLAENIDLTRARLTAAMLANGYDHYLRNGDAEMRSGHWLFDPLMHRAAREEQARLHPEIVGGPGADGIGQAGGPGSRGEFDRFVRGDRSVASEHPLSWYFDPRWYLATYPNVAAEIRQGLWSCALEHYLRTDQPFAYDPNGYFSEEFYRSIHLDLASAFEAGQFRNGFEHFLRFGARERRKPHATVDLNEQFRPVSVQNALQQGHLRDVFSHYVATRTAGDGFLRAGATPVEIDESVTRQAYALACHNMLPTLVRNPPDFRAARREASEAGVAAAPALSVIVVACNRFAFTLATLASLRMNYPGAMQVILVDSGSRDEISTIEDLVPGIDIVRFRHNAGFVDGCNAGLARATAPATLFLNNDVQLNPGAIGLALARLWKTPATGAVGAKIIRTHGRLQEAGSIVWSDGNVAGYLRDGDPNAPEANFVRPVDYCAAAFLLVRTDLLRLLGGFDTAYRPAYFEETDLCARLRRLGFDTIYDPAVSIVHYEFGTTDAASSARMVERNLPVFRQRQAEFLARQLEHAPASFVAARTAVQAPRNTPPGDGAPGARLRRILFIEDRLPFRHLGSGFTRSNDIVRAMAALGHQVTLFPIYQAIETPAAIYREFPDSVEVIFDRELPDLGAFLSDRAGYFDMVWISRTHNLDRLMPTLCAGAQHIPTHRLVLDTEAVAALRAAERQKIVAGLQGASAAPAGPVTADAVAAAVKAEVGPALLICECVVAVNEVDAAAIRAVELGSATVAVEVLGHVQPRRDGEAADRGASLFARDWAARLGLMFLGAIHDQDSPNRDALTWFAQEVLPRLDDQLPAQAMFAIAGTTARGIDLSALGRHRRVELLGQVADLDALYGRHRVFVAPTRFAAGIPYKLHEAAAHGVPIVATPLLCRQLGWRPGLDMLVADVDDPQGFADAVTRLHQDEGLWRTIRDNALARVRTENDPRGYQARLSKIIEDVCG